MRKRILSMMMIILITLLFVGCDRQTQTKVRLNEVVHSIFYAPQYVALEKGFFIDEGLEVELTTGWGADKSMTALLANHADIALMGPEASFYVYQEGQKNYAINFAQPKTLLCRKAPNMIHGSD